MPWAPPRPLSLVVASIPGQRPGLVPRTRSALRQERLRSGGVDAVVIDSPGPVALPVNFATHNGDVVFRTNESVSSGVETNETVGFEVDRIDDAMSAGWDVW